MVQVQEGAAAKLKPAEQFLTLVPEEDDIDVGDNVMYNQQLGSKTLFKTSSLEQSPRTTS